MDNRNPLEPLPVNQATLDTTIGLVDVNIEAAADMAEPTQSWDQQHLCKTSTWEPDDYLKPRDRD